MLLPTVEILKRNDNNVVTLVKVNGLELTPCKPERNNCRGIVFYKNLVIKFNDYDQLKQNEKEYKNWLKVVNNREYKNDKQYFAEILYCCPEYEYIIQRRYEFRERDTIDDTLQFESFQKVKMLIEKYSLGYDFSDKFHNWDLTLENTVKLYDFGSTIYS